MCTFSVSNVIYHKFSHGAAFYTHNGKNVNVMLELLVARYKLPVSLSKQEHDEKTMNGSYISRGLRVNII